MREILRWKRHNDVNSTVAFMTPTLEQLMERFFRRARLTRGPRPPGKPIKSKLPLPDDLDEPSAAIQQHELE